MVSKKRKNPVRKTRTYWNFCALCGGLDVENVGWIHMNTGKPTDDECAVNDTWCPDCEENNQGYKSGTRREAQELQKKYKKLQDAS